MPTLDRLIPEEAKLGEATGTESLAIHLARYDFASHYVVKPGRLLDVACGVGYGTALLAERHPSVECTGVDIDAEAIAYAERVYPKENVRYLAADAMRFDEREGFDTIVSLETIEHVSDADIFVDRLFSLLRANGRLIASAPSSPTLDGNPFHVRDFTERSFRRLFIRRGLTEVARLRLGQAYSPIAVVRRSEARLVNGRRGLLRYYAGHPGVAMRRLAWTLRHGFENRYLIVAWQRNG